LSLIWIYFYVLWSLSVNYIFYLYFFYYISPLAVIHRHSDRLQWMLWLSAIFICRKCRNNEAAYPAFGLENVMKLEHLTAHWTWSGLSRAISNIKVDLKGLQILTPNLQQRLQDLLYACGLNLTAHRITVLPVTIHLRIFIYISIRYTPTFYFYIFPSESKAFVF